jgi:hypothetical protein
MRAAAWPSRGLNYYRLHDLITQQLIAYRVPKMDSTSQALRGMTARAAQRQPRERPVGRVSRYIL